jgi:hypothetical protein
MTSHQAVCHLNDWLKGVLGIRVIPQLETTLPIRVLRFIAFSTPLPWPRGFRTAPEQDQEKHGTRPGDFSVDVAELQTLIDQFVERRGRDIQHYRWGRMSVSMWGRYGYRHVDHHLRQFGV